MIHEEDPHALSRALAEAYVPDDPDAPWWKIYAGLHDKQRAAIDDPSAEKAFEKGRRGGGSVVVAAWLLQEYHRWPNATSLFIALTIDHARSILWPELVLLDAKYSMGAAFNAKDLEVTYPNGYKIVLRGAKDRVQIEKLRGRHGGLRRCAIDEAGSFVTHDEQFRYMIDSVIRPQFMDTHARGGGQIVLCGSPAADPMGFFYEKCTGLTHEGKPARTWSTHHWTALHNPFVDARGYFIQILPDHIIDDTPAEEMFEEIWALRDVPMRDPRWAEVASRLSNQFRNEYLADWIRDETRIIYLPTDRNLLPRGWELPRDRPWRISIGCDVGWGDGNGFAVCAKSLTSRDIIVLEAYYLAELDTSQIADELAMLRDKWRTGEIYVDTGGEGGRLLADLENYGVLAMGAHKPRKKPRIEYVRALIRTGALKLRPEFTADVVTEWSALPWSEDRQNHREGFVDDVADALLMAANPLSQRFMPAGSVRPRPGDPGFDRYQEQLEKQAAIRRGRRIVRRRRTALVLVPPPAPPHPDEALPLAA
jgi:hypothetical protein